MRGFRGAWPLIRGRFRTDWRLLAVLAFGILAAATLLATSPVYTRVMNDEALSVGLRDQIGSSTRNSAIRFGLPLGAPEAKVEMRALSRIMAVDAAWLAEGEERYGRLNDLTLITDLPLDPMDPQRTFVSLQTQSSLDRHLTVVEGRLAEATDDPARIEALLTREGAAFLRASVGDRLVVGHGFDDCNRPPPTDDPVEAREQARFACVPEMFATVEVSLTVVGFVDQADGDDPFWGAGSLSFGRPHLSEEEGAVVPILVPEGSFYGALSLAFPGLPAEFRATRFASIAGLNAANIDEARETLTSLRLRVEESGAVASFGTAGPLASFSRRASFNQVTLLLLLFQVVGIAAYFVVLVASLLAERRSAEIAMLRSRGATVGQIVAMAAAEALSLGLAAALAAPFLASAAVAALGKTGTFATLSDGGFLPFTIVPASFLFALGGAAIAVVAVIVPAFVAARRGMVVYLRGAARPETPLLQRYYLDMGLAGVAALALWQLDQRGSVFDPRSVGGWSADPLLLLSPLLLILATGALLFRFLPLVLGLLSRLTRLAAGPGVALSLMQLTRNPARYSQLALLVVMAAAVGTFAATYSATTERSHEERAIFQTGADLRTSSLGDLDNASPRQIRESLAAIPGVEAAGAATRLQLSLGPIRAFGEELEVLGVDPETAEDLLSFRPDFADESLATLMNRIQGSRAAGSGLVLMGEPTAVSVWANPTQERPSSTLWVRTVDAESTYRLHELGALDYSGGYRKLETAFDPRAGVAYPLSIVALLITQPGSGSDPATGSLLLDDLAISLAGEEMVVEDFEGQFRWDVIRTGTQARDITQRIDQGVYRGNGAAQFGFRTGISRNVRGIYLSDANIPIPAIVSERFLEHNGGAIGNEFELVLGSVVVPVTIQGSAALFPTLSDSANGFIVLNQEHLFFFAGLTLSRNPTEPNEIWLNVDPAARADVLAALAADYGIATGLVVDVETLLEEVRTDPIVLAGGNGILLIALVAAFTILALGFAFTLYMGGQARTVEVSVMRTVGLAPGQVFAMITIEYLLVAVIGLVVGTLAGLQISETMLSFLDVTEDGTRVLPPFARATRWGTVAVAYAATAAAFLTGVSALALYFLRLPVSRILRLSR